MLPNRSDRAEECAKGCEFYPFRNGHVVKKGSLFGRSSRVECLMVCSCIIRLRGEGTDLVTDLARRLYCEGEGGRVRTPAGGPSVSGVAAPDERSQA
jgi:hypothetical protein